MAGKRKPKNMYEVRVSIFDHACERGSIITFRVNAATPIAACRKALKQIGTRVPYAITRFKITCIDEAVKDREKKL